MLDDNPNDTHHQPALLIREASAPAAPVVKKTTRARREDGRDAHPRCRPHEAAAPTETGGTDAVETPRRRR